MGERVGVRCIDDRGGDDCGRQPADSVVVKRPKERQLLPRLTPYPRRPLRRVSVGSSLPGAVNAGAKLLATLMLALTGCHHGALAPADVYLALPTRTFLLSTGNGLQTVPVDLVNASPMPIVTRGCGGLVVSRIETQTDPRTWVVTGEFNGACDGTLEVPPGTTLRFQLPLPGKGVHRATVLLEPRASDAATALRSPRFVVR